jgi:hypothetical protein
LLKCRRAGPPDRRSWPMILQDIGCARAFDRGGGHQVARPALVLVDVGDRRPCPARERAEV